MGAYQCDECGSKAFTVRVAFLKEGQTKVERLECRTCDETFEIGAMPTLDDWG